MAGNAARLMVPSAFMASPVTLFVSGTCLMQTTQLYDFMVVLYQRLSLTGDLVDVLRVFLSAHTSRERQHAVLQISRDLRRPRAVGRKSVNPEGRRLLDRQFDLRGPYSKYKAPRQPRNTNNPREAQI